MDGESRLDSFMWHQEKSAAEIRNKFVQLLKRYTRKHSKSNKIRPLSSYSAIHEKGTEDIHSLCHIWVTLFIKDRNSVKDKEL